MLLENVIERGEEDDEVWKSHPGAVLDRGVGEQSSLPVACVSVFSALPRRRLHQVPELPPAAHEQDDPAAVRHVSREVQRPLEVFCCLLQIYDVNIQTRAEHVRFHQPRERNIA